MRCTIEEKDVLALFDLVDVYDLTGPSGVLTGLAKACEMKAEESRVVWQDESLGVWWEDKAHLMRKYEANLRRHMG